MTNFLSRLFLGVSAALLLFGGAVHTMLITLAIVFGLIAVRPVMASSVVVALLMLMPAIVAILLYCFIGAIMPAHLLVVVAVLGFAAAVLRPET